MKIVFALVAAVALVSCTTQAYRQHRQSFQQVDAANASYRACAKSLRGRPELSALLDGTFFMDPWTLRQLNDPNKPSKEQAEAVYAFHSLLAHCRKRRIESISKVAPAFVPPIARDFARKDKIYLLIANREQTWGVIRQKFTSSSQKLEQEWQEAERQIVTRVEAAHRFELGQMNAAAQAIQDWNNQQQQLFQSGQTRTTNCRIIGDFVSCTTS